MNKIIINGSIQKELSTILATMCLQIQKEFDIAPSLLNNLINQQEFLVNCQFLYEQCHGEMLVILDQFKDNYINYIANDKKIAIDGSEYEKCGCLNKTHKNGYKEYCNIHRYLHPHPQMPVTRKFGPWVEHDFVVKNVDKIIKEKYNNSVHIIYQNFVNKLYSLVRQLFDYEVNRSCYISTLIVNSENIADLLNKMNDNNNIFKNKSLYEHINVKNTSSQIDNDKTSFYYLKVYNCTIFIDQEQ